MSVPLPSVPACSTTPEAPGFASSLATAERAFGLLTTGPHPLSVDGRAVGHGLPRRPIPLDELRAILLHPATGQAARDACWRLLVTRARGQGPAWKVGAVGVAAPGLRAASARLHRLTGFADIQAELLTGFLTALAGIDLSPDRVAARLVNAALVAARRLVRAEDAARAGRVAISEAMTLPPVPYGHPDLVLARAVAAGVISVREARVIGATRLENVRLADYAARIGSTYEAVRRCRIRGEARLVTALRDGTLSDPTTEIVHAATHDYGENYAAGAIHTGE